MQFGETSHFYCCIIFFARNLHLYVGTYTIYLVCTHVCMNSCWHEFLQILTHIRNLIILYIKKCLWVVVFIEFLSCRLIFMAQYISYVVLRSFQNIYVGIHMNCRFYHLLLLELFVSNIICLGYINIFIHIKNTYIHMYVYIRPLKKLFQWKVVHKPTSNNHFHYICSGFK